LGIDPVVSRHATGYDRRGVKGQGGSVFLPEGTGCADDELPEA
jgi:hypothetical protein